MRSKTAEKILKSVMDSYHIIANEFSDTRQYNWKEFEYFKKYLLNEANIIDLGCGNGRLLKFLYQKYLNNNFKYIGIDNSKKLLKKAKEIHPEGIFIFGDQIDIPIEDDRADIIFNIAAFHHIPSKKLRLKALNEMRRALRKNGILILTVWNLWQSKYWLAILTSLMRFITSLGNYHLGDFFIPWKNNKGVHLSNRYYHSFLPRELNKLIKNSGFEIIENFTAKKGKKVPFLQGFNYCVIAKKK